MRTIISVVFTFVALILSGGTCFAQRGLPPGDYRATCQDMRADGSRLSARCQRRDGGWRNTSLDYRNCGGAIINDDGNLRCGQGGPGADNSRRGMGWQGGQPGGDYQRTCRNIRVNGNRLEASCQKRDGGWRNTSLNSFSRCNTIANEDGRLTCGH